MMAEIPSASAIGGKRHPDDSQVPVVTVDDDDDVVFVSESSRSSKQKRSWLWDDDEDIVISKRLKLLLKPKGKDYFQEKLRLDCLPNEIIAQILGNLSPNDLLNCRLVSKDWNALSCLRLRNTHTPIELEHTAELKYFISSLHQRIPGQRIPFTRFSFHLDKLSVRSVEEFLAQTELDIKNLTLITEGPSKWRKVKRKGEPAGDSDPVKFFLGKLQQGLKELTITFVTNKKNVSGDLALVRSYAVQIQHLPSVGLSNVILSPNLLSEFQLLTQVQPLRLAKLGVELRKLPGESHEQLLGLFYTWLQSHSSILIDLSINSCLVGVKIPPLPKLQRLSLGVHSIEERRVNTFANITPTQFPSLTFVSLNSFLVNKTTVKYDSVIGAFRGSVFPTVHTLDLRHILPDASYPLSFPNLEKLSVGPNVAKRVLLDVLSHYNGIMSLTLTMSTVAWDWWDALTGGAKRRRRSSLATPAVVDLEKDFVLGGPLRGSLYLGDLAELKSLKMDMCHEDVVDALVYLTANEFIPRLDKLSITTLEALEYPPELLRILHKYHGKVTIN